MSDDTVACSVDPEAWTSLEDRNAMQSVSSSGHAGTSKAPTKVSAINSRWQGRSDAGFVDSYLDALMRRPHSPRR